MKVVALIPARKGSKGIPGKNMISVLGKPLITYSLEAAHQSKMISQIWVSSDCDVILDYSSKFHNVNIHRRDIALAGDTSPITSTVAQIFDLCNDCDALLLLQPTSPIRTGQQIDDCIDLLINNREVNSIVSICATNDMHPARMYWKNSVYLSSIMPEFETFRRQDIPCAYYRNGAIYLVRKEAFLKNNQIICSPILGYEMPGAQLLNIDEPRDLIIAGPIIDAWKKGLL